jgi:predicted alpha/beta superfamily hydrolase
MTEGEKYPVLYLLDAEAQMEMVAGQVRYLSDVYRIVPNMIVVGIANTDRVRDLTPPIQQLAMMANRTQVPMLLERTVAAVKNSCLLSKRN